MSRSPARYQHETNPVQPIFLTTDPTGCRHARLPIGTLMQYADCMLQQANLPRNLAGTRQLIRSHPGNQCLCPPTSRPMRCCVSGGIRRKRIWRVTSIGYSLKRCTPACLAVSGVPIIRAICVMPCTPVCSESSRSKSRCVRDDSSDASARSAKQAASGRPELRNATTPSPPPGDCARTDLVDAVYRSTVTYLTLCSCLHHESRTHSLRSPHGARDMDEPIPARDTHPRSQSPLARLDHDRHAAGWHDPATRRHPRALPHQTGQRKIRSVAAVPPARTFQVALPLAAVVVVGVALRTLVWWPSHNLFGVLEY